MSKSEELILMADSYNIENWEIFEKIRIPFIVSACLEFKAIELAICTGPNNSVDHARLNREQREIRRLAVRRPLISVEQYLHNWLNEHGIFPEQVSLRQRLHAQIYERQELYNALRVIRYTANNSGDLKLLLPGELCCTGITEAKPTLAKAAIESIQSSVNVARNQYMEGLLLNCSGEQSISSFISNFSI